MKKLEFKTSKGKFLVLDDNETDEMQMRKSVFEYYVLKQITEQQSSEIIDNHNGLYNTYALEDYGNMTRSSIHSLQSLLKSKGVYLYDNPHNTVEAEQKTFYNPVILKLC